MAAMVPVLNCGWKVVPRPGCEAAAVKRAAAPCDEVSTKRQKSAPERQPLGSGGKDVAQLRKLVPAGPRIKYVERPRPAKAPSAGEHFAGEHGGKLAASSRLCIAQTQLWALLSEPFSDPDYRLYALPTIDTLIELSDCLLFESHADAVREQQRPMLLVSVPRWLERCCQPPPSPVDLANCLQQLRLESEERYALRDQRHLCYALFPDPPDYAASQRHEGFEATLERFYVRGLLPIAQRTCGVRTAEELRERQLLLELPWAQLIRNCSRDRRDEANIWRLLWVSAAELLEWYLERGPLHYQQFALAHYETVCGRAADEAQPSSEVNVLRELTQCWRMLEAQTPREMLPAGKRQAALVVQEYVLGPLRARLQHAAARNHGKAPLELLRPRALPPWPPLAELLRTPQLDRLPPGWSWKRQVRTRRGDYFGVQDLMFFASWEENFDNRNRHRSYNEIEQSLRGLPRHAAPRTEAWQPARRSASASEASELSC